MAAGAPANRRHGSAFMPACGAAACRAPACNNHEINLFPLPPVNPLHCLPDRLFQPRLTRYKAVTTNFQNLTAVKASQNPFFHNRLTY
jgi:hypothetical protein